MNRKPFFRCPYNINQNVYRTYNSNSRNKPHRFAAFSGIVTSIDDFSPAPDSSSAGCYKLMSLENSNREPVNFVISPETYFVDYKVISVGDKVTGFYDADAPAILIYPPQYAAIVVAKSTKSQNVSVDYFDKNLVNTTGSLKLNISPSTEVILTNNQPFSATLGNRNLVVVYGPTTKSIPAQTTPYKVIVLC